MRRDRGKKFIDRRGIIASDKRDESQISSHIRSLGWCKLSLNVYTKFETC